MENILNIAIGIAVGAVVGWLLAKAKVASAIQAEKDAAQLKYSELEKEFVGYKATTTSQLNTVTANLDAKSSEIAGLNQTIDAKVNEIFSLNNQVSNANADLRAVDITLLDKNETILGIKKELSTGYSGLK